jgi:phage shock protein PspC (stress-responsive transcriptional regulator)
MALFCHRCGTGLPVSARFCSSCGQTLPAPRFEPGRPLIRPRLGRNIAGVCAALARAYGWDVSLVRILCVLSFFFTGGVVAVAYLACWIGIPEEPLGAPGEYPPMV